VDDDDDDPQVFAAPFFLLRRPRLDRQGLTGILAQSMLTVDLDTRVGLNSIREKNMHLAIAGIHSAHSRSTPIRVEIHQLHRWPGTTHSLLATALVLSPTRSSQMNGGGDDISSPGDGAALLLPPPPPLPSFPLT
jgi:hypothetical protein